MWKDDHDVIAWEIGILCCSVETLWEGRACAWSGQLVVSFQNTRHSQVCKFTVLQDGKVRIMQMNVSEICTTLPSDTIPNYTSVKQIPYYVKLQNDCLR